LGVVEALDGEDFGGFEEPELPEEHAAETIARIVRIVTPVVRGARRLRRSAFTVCSRPRSARVPGELPGDCTARSGDNSVRGAPERSAGAGRGADARGFDRIHLVLTNRAL
jgi:hypothetical protein